MIKIIITGANGFLGENLLRVLGSVDNYDVYGIVRQSSEVSNYHYKIIKIKNDYEDLPSIIKNLNPDVIIHTATYFHAEHKMNDISPMIQSIHNYGNILLESIKNCEKDIFFINTGTSWQHYRDSKAYNPVGLHAAHKEAFEKVIEFYSTAYGIKYTTLKLFDTYGLNDKRNKIINILINAFKKNESLKLSPGHQLIDIVHIEDVCNAYKLIIKNIFENQKILTCYGVSSGKEVSLIDIAKLIETIAGYSIELKWGDREYRAREVMYNWRSSMELVPGWVPKIDLIEGLTHLFYGDM